MFSQKISRRKAISSLALGGAAATLPIDTGTFRIHERDDDDGRKVFRFCLNTSTISGQNPGLLKYIQVASQAGFDGIEVWISDVQAYLAQRF